MRLTMIVALSVGVSVAACASAPPSNAPTAPSSPQLTVSAEPAAAPSAEPTSSPLALTRAWLQAVSAGDWAALVAIAPPEERAKAERSLANAPEAAKAERMRSLQKTAAKMKAALAAGEPKFVVVKAVLAEPEHLEWYYCGEAPQGDVWKSPCAVSVVEADGRFYFLDITDYDE